MTKSRLLLLLPSLFCFILAHEQNFNNLLEKSRNLELLLLKTRLDISRNSPELVLKEVSE